MILFLAAFLGLYFFLDSGFPDQEPLAAMAPEDPIRAKYKDLIKTYDSFFTEEFQRTGTPGAAVVIVKDTTVLFAKGFGVKKLYTMDSIDVNTVFRTGSLSKGFASVLAGTLVEAGDFSWEDKVVDHLPFFALKSRQQSRNVKINHLLSHTTGLPYHAYTNLVESGKGIRSIAPYFREVDLIGKPGEIYAYQNAAFGLIEEIVLKTTARTFQRQMAERIFTPADMVQASTSYEEIVSNSNIALPHFYSRRKKKWRVGSISKKYYNLPSTGGINASILDMGNWLKVVMGHRPDIISEQTLDYIFQPFVRSNNRRRYFRKWNLLDEAHYGMGWRVLALGSDTVLYHGGYVNGYRSEISFDREEKIGICVLFNAPSEMASQCIPSFWDIYYAFESSALKTEEHFTEYRN